MKLHSLMTVVLILAAAPSPQVFAGGSGGTSSTVCSCKLFRLAKLPSGIQPKSDAAAQWMLSEIKRMREMTGAYHAGDQTALSIFCNNIGLIDYQAYDWLNFRKKFYASDEGVELNCMAKGELPYNDAKFEKLLGKVVYSEWNAQCDADPAVQTRQLANCHEGALAGIVVAQRAGFPAKMCRSTSDDHIWALALVSTTPERWVIVDRYSTHLDDGLDTLANNNISIGEDKALYVSGRRNPKGDSIFENVTCMSLVVP